MASLVDSLFSNEVKIPYAKLGDKTDNTSWFQFNKTFYSPKKPKTYGLMNRFFVQPSFQYIIFYIFMDWRHTNRQTDEIIRSMHIYAAKLINNDRWKQKIMVGYYSKPLSHSKTYSFFYIQSHWPLFDIFSLFKIFFLQR